MDSSLTASKRSKANDREVVSLFHIHGYIINSQGKGSHRADYAIQTIWETPKRRGSESARQCRVCVTDYTSFWEGILTRQDLDAERNSRFEDEVEKDRYESLTREAFMGPDPDKEESGKRSVSLSVRSSAASSLELVLTWAGMVTKTVRGRQSQEKTILGTMLLKRVATEESSEILCQWIKSTIEERMKIEYMASSLKSHVDGVKQQYQECNEALENFTKEKIEFTNNLLEKFRLLLNSKKEKIVKLVDMRNKQQERIENLEKALREERKMNAELRGKKITEADVDISDVKKQEASDAEEGANSTSMRGSGRGRGRGRGLGRGSGKGRAELASRQGADNPSQSSESASDTKLSRAKVKSMDTNYVEVSTPYDADEPQLPLLLPHPQDGYGWDGNDVSSKGKDEKDNVVEDQEEPLVRRGKSLIDRVSRAAAHVPSHQQNDTDKTSLSPRKSAIKREESDAADVLLRRNQAEVGQSRRPSKHSENGTSKRLRSDDSESVGSSVESTHARKITKADSPSETGASSRPRRNFPVVAMRRSGVPKASMDRTTPESGISSPEGSSSPSGARGVRVNASPELLRRTASATGARSGLARRTKDSASNGGSIISHEDLIRNME